MANAEQLFGADDLYDDEFDCDDEGRVNLEDDEEEEEGGEANEVMVVKEEFDSDKEIVDQQANESLSTVSVIKTEEQDETFIDMFDDEFHQFMEQNFSAKKNANDTNETDSDATEIADNPSVSDESHQTEPVVSGIFNSSSVEQQLRRRQGKTKNHKCQHCNKSFLAPSHLKRHKLVHTGIREHKCSTCSKTFARRDVLKDHQLVHTGIRPYKCTTCSQSFKHSTHLKDHQLLHTGIKPHTCTVCFKSFTKKAHLKNHQLVHTGIKAHTCTTCSKSFTRKDCLKDHQRTHSDSKPFQCTICQKKFKSKLGLKGHFQTKHPQ